VKPDIGAPGGGIYSTWPIALGGYATGWGTSMASPHVAGAVALLLQARPHTPANAVRSILQSSAVPALWFGNPGLGYLDTVQKQGAGLLHIDRAIVSTTIVEPGKLSLGESQGGPAVRTLTITNASDADVTYDLSHTPALSTGPNTFSLAFTTGFAGVAFSVPSVIVPAGGRASVDVTITANPALPDRSVYDGYSRNDPERSTPINRTARRIRCRGSIFRMSSCTWIISRDCCERRSKARVARTGTPRSNSSTCRGIPHPARCSSMRGTERRRPRRRHTRYRMATTD
jgi:hypothetical protein